MMSLVEFEALVSQLEVVGDVSRVVMRDGSIHLDLQDFEGFDDDWSEIFRECARPDLVDQFEEFVDEVAEGDFYQYFELEGVHFCVGYASMDI